MRSFTGITGHPGCRRELLPAVLIGIGLIGCTSTPTVQAPEPSPTAPPASPQIVKEETPPDSLLCKRIVVSAVGDIMLGTDYPENHLADDDGESLLAGVTAALSRADITFGNLEGVLIDGGEPAKQCKNPDACYLFRSPTRYAALLKEAGFDVISLANNHARDFGEEGRTGTMAALDAEGIYHSGRVGDVASWDVAGLSISMVAFSTTAESHSMYAQDMEASTALIAGLKAKHDVVMVSFHGGAEGMDAARIPFTEEEYYGESRGDVVAFSRAMIDAGADLVIGHGPHIPRAMELYRDRLIAYSLGNFATYYGISVSESKGYAPILNVTLDGFGRLVSGEVISAIQIRPAGPRIDDQNRAYEMIRELTRLDFNGGGLTFQDDGQFNPETMSSGEFPIHCQ